MLISCWSPKGGAGTTVVAAALGLLLARTHGHPGALLVDLAGDVPLVLGPPGGGGDPDAPGLAQWLAAGPDVPADALGRIEEPVAHGLALLRRGRGPLAPGGAELLAAVLASDPRPVVADCGRIDADSPPDGAAFAVAAAAHRSLLVLRPCFLALRRAADAPLRPTGVVLVDEPGRSLGARDVEDSLGTPVVARVRCTDTVARSVDAGLLAARLPRTLSEDLGGAA